MLIQILSLLLGTAAGLLSIAFLARVWMQWMRAPFRNPVGQFVITFTNWAVLPLRRIIPGLFGIDLASVFAAWLTQFAYLAVMASLAAGSLVALAGFLAIAWVAVIAVLKMFIYLLMGVVILAALMSWISPHSPAAPLFNGLAAPLLAPVRRVVPIFGGGIDLSPLVVILLLQVVLIVLENLH
ncbi:MAG: YggT family protein [Pseudomonadota bacterium]